MKIERFSIKNFRSIEDIEIELSDRLMCLVGRNDVGKSTVIKALETFFGKRSFLKEDFPFRSPEDISTEIEVTFKVEIASENLQPFITGEGQLIVRHSYRKTVPNPSRIIECHVDFNPPSDEKLQGYTDLKKAGKEIGVEFPNQKPKEREEIERLEKKVRSKLAELKGTKVWVDVSKNWGSFSGAMPELIVIPAAQDPTSEQKMTSDSSVFGSLFRVGMKKMIKVDPESRDAVTLLEKKMTDINQKMIQMVEGKLRTQGSHFSLSQLPDPLDVSKGFTFQMEVEDKDGVKTPLSQRGNGLQRSVLIAIIRAQSELNHIIQQKVVQEEDPEGSGDDNNRSDHKGFLYLIEEPEAFLHLSAQRELYYAIKGLLTDGSQAIITTHSTMFMDESDFSQIVSLHREEGKTFADQASDYDEIKEYLGESLRVSELMPGKVCCMVEGRSDEKAFKIWSKKLGYDLKKQGVHFIDMNGCRNAEYYANARIMKDFSVDFFVLLDTDTHTPERAGEIRKTLLDEYKVSDSRVIILKKGELENYFPITIIEDTYKMANGCIDQIEFEMDPKKAINTALQKSGFQRIYKERRDTEKIVQRMDKEDIHEDIKDVIQRLVRASGGEIIE